MVAERKLIMVKPLSAKPAASFAEGAARFAEMARQVKALQIAEQRGAAPRPQAAEITSPDEQWARNFASRAFGPAGVDTISARAPVCHARDFAPDLSALRPPAKPTVFQAADLGLPKRPLEAGAPMDIAFRRDAPVRRSFLKRLFGRS